MLCIAALSFFSSLHCYNGFETYYHEYNASRTLEQRFFYDYYPAEQWLFSHRGSVEFGKNDKFQQLDKIYNLVWSVSRDSKRLDQELHFGYDYFYNRSEPLASQGVTRIHKRTAGYDLLWKVTDSLTIDNDVTYHYESEDDRFVPNHILLNRGLQDSHELNYNARLGIHDIAVHGNFEQTALEYQWRKRYGADCTWQFNTDNQNYSSDFSYYDNDDRIYTLIAHTDSVSQYKHTDTQIRRNLQAGFNYDRILAHDVSLHVMNQFSYLKNHLNEAVNKNNTDTGNFASLTLRMPFWTTFRGFATAESQYQDKEFKVSSNSRTIENRRVQYGVSYNFRDADSIYVTHDLQLNTTKYETSNGLDNDAVTDSWLFGIESNFKKRILWRTAFSQTKWKEIYIDSALSANNSIRTSYLLQPGMDFVIGDCILLQQMYQLRADYDDFVYSYIINPTSGEQIIKDRFYRQIIANYRVEYNDYPVVRRYSYKDWENLPSRFINMNYFSISTGFRFEHNETGDKNDSDEAYSISAQNNIRSFDIAVQKFYKQTEFKFQPKYNFGDVHEMDVLFNINYYFRNDSFVKFSINPTGQQWKSLIWRATIELNYEY